MRSMRAWMLRLGGLFFRRKEEQDFLQQIQSDIDLHTEDGIRAGLTPGEARRAETHGARPHEAPGVRKAD